MLLARIDGSVSGSRYILFLGEKKKATIEFKLVLFADSIISMRLNNLAESIQSMAAACVPI